mmetsp:Transcript_47682/g.111645  ORF Transcript_47682/g.111645 Transcript_47682/m.111645 type:complete len:244 (-) Transcript_47682:87-818(-)
MDAAFMDLAHAATRDVRERPVPHSVPVAGLGGVGLGGTGRRVNVRVPPWNIFPLVDPAQHWMNLHTFSQRSVDLPQHVATQVVDAVVHVAADRFIHEVTAGPTIAVAMIHAPHVRGICFEGGVEELCVHEILKLMEGVHHSPFVHFVVFLAIEEQDRGLLQVRQAVDMALCLPAIRVTHGRGNVNMPIVAAILLIGLHAAPVRGARGYAGALHARREGKKMVHCHGAPGRLPAHGVPGPPLRC